MSQYLDWKVGDRVVFEPNKAFLGGSNLERGKTYVISKIDLWPEGKIFRVEGQLRRMTKDSVVIGLQGISSLNDASLFRKAQPRNTDISIFTQMLNSSKPGVDA